jgi:WD40 repeat protein
VTVTGEDLPDPYKGLAAFDANDVDARLFFGRERETEIVVANALASRLTVLYGPSGVGKSSLLRAGVVQRLRTLAEIDPIGVAYFSSWAGSAPAGLEAAARAALADAEGGDPGDAPGELADRFEAWTSALGCRLCLVLDQFEELFLYEGGSELVEALPELVVRPGLRVNVVLGIRDDQLARLDVFKARIPGLFSNYLRLNSLDRVAARGAILGPLQRYNELAGDENRVTIEPDLVEALLVEVAAGRIESGGREPAADANGDRIEAPYLQLVLQRLWNVERERRSDSLRHATLIELGGARSIVEDHLERAMQALTPSQQDVAAEMFGHLVTPSGSKIAHGASDLATFARVDQEQLEPVLSSLARERILRPTGASGVVGGLYEIYHDVLTGAVLDWRTRHESETALTLEREASRRRQRRFAAVAGASLIALLVLAVLTVFAFSQRSTARHQARLARAGELLQQAEADVAVDPAAAVRDAMASAAIDRTAHTEPVLRAALLATNARLQLRAAGPATAGAYSSNSRRFALADSTGQVRVFRLPDGKRLATLRTGSPAQAVAFSPDGGSVATAARDGHVALWNLAAPQTPVRVLNHDAPVASVAFSPNGGLLLTAGGKSAKVWDAQSGQLMRVLPHPRLVRSATFNSTGTLALTVSRDRVARVWTVATGKIASRLRQGAEITAAAFGPGDFVVTGARDDTGAIWNARTGARRSELLGHSSEVLAVAFSPIGDRVATGSADGSSRVWRLDGRLLDVVRSERAGVNTVGFSPDGQSLATGSSDGSAITSGQAQGTEHLLGQDGPLQAAFFSPDGLTVATVSGSTARLWDPYGEPVLEQIHSGGVAATALAFDPTGALLASGDLQGEITLERAHGGLIRTVQLGSPIVTLAWAKDGVLLAGTKNGTVRLLGDKLSSLRTLSHGSQLVGAALRDDGTVFATAGVDGVVRLWNARTGAAILRVVPPAPVAAIALDPTGRLFATADGDDVVVFDARTGTARAVLRGHADTVTGIAFSPDGSLLASSSKDHNARVWSTTTFTSIKLLHRHVAFVSGVVFSADGRWLATAGPSKAGVWAATANDFAGSFLFFVRGNQAPITSVAFSPLGHELATAARDGSVRVVDCHLCGDLASLESYARFRLSRLDR